MHPIPRTENLLSDLPSATDAEIFTTLLQRPGIRIERIVSGGDTASPGDWYDQPDDEWVMVLSGHAVLGFADGAEDASETLCPMEAGDCVLIPAHLRHRVFETARGEPTVWLAVHFSPAEAEKGVG